MAAGLFFLAEACVWAQATRPGAAPQPAAPVPANPSLFPEPEPKLVEKASLQGLLKALGAQDHESVTQMTWQLLAAMAVAKGQGISPSEFLAAGYRAEHLKGTDAAAVQGCLLSAWMGAQTLALFTPENMAVMQQGNAPRVTRGPERGMFVNLDMDKLPLVALTTKPPARAAAAAAAAPEALPAPEPVAMPATFVVKTLEIRLHEKTPLDAYGLRNMDIRLDSINANGSVSFLFEDRSAQHTGYDDRTEALNRLGSRMGLSEGVGRMVNFTPVPIPDTQRRGIKLLTQPFATVFLDEDIGTQLNLHLIVRVNSEALNYDRLPPERQKLYQVRNP
ncbi:MAG TPA: hypothetical protein VK961_14475 [Chthoniobacter sp.]|nr:hypothetical protein [Chthoniobacter sp.]